jgi:NarL family two-component system response regulator LiaR
MKPIRVLLVDDHPVVRAGIRVELDKSADISVIGEAGTGEECLRLVEELAPDLLLLDMALPDLDGVEVTSKVRETCPQVRVLVFSGYTADAFVFGALEAGAIGYLLKDEMLPRIGDAVRAAMRGEVVLSGRVARKAMGKMFRNQETGGPAVALTEREIEVLRLVSLFRTNDEIGAQLDVTIKTVEYHLANIMLKLGTDSRREAARWAWDQGLVVT